MFDPTNSEKYVSNMHRGAEYLHPGIASISFIKVWMTCDAPLFCLCAPSFLHDYNRDMLYSTELLWSILRHMEWTFIATRTSTIGSRYLFFFCSFGSEINWIPNFRCANSKEISMEYVHIYAENHRIRYWSHGFPYPNLFPYVSNAYTVRK